MGAEPAGVPMPARRRRTRQNRTQMTQLVAEQVLILLHIRGKTERPKWSLARRHEVPDPPGDENVNQVVVKRIPRQVAIRCGPLDQTRHLVDNSRRSSTRATAFIVREEQRHFWPCER